MSTILRRNLQKFVNYNVKLAVIGVIRAITASRAGFPFRKQPGSSIFFSRDRREAINAWTKQRNVGENDESEREMAKLPVSLFFVLPAIVFLGTVSISTNCRTSRALVHAVDRFEHRGPMVRIIASGGERVRNDRPDLQDRVRFPRRFADGLRECVGRSSRTIRPKTRRRCCDGLFATPK
jgi:hypothetical protein